MHQTNKWSVFEQVSHEIEQLAQTAPEEYEQVLSMLQNKMQRVGELKKSLDYEDYLLKKQYMKLMKEKSMFACKLSDIASIGNNLEWEQRSRLLEKIRPIIETGKYKLRAGPKQMGNESQVTLESNK